MGLEVDLVKSSSNLAKHGEDFDTAQELWADPDLIEFRLAYRSRTGWLSA
jgi:uncharacterized DUF497 family protein